MKSASNIHGMSSGPFTRLTAQRPVAVITIPAKPRRRDPRLFKRRPPKMPAMLVPKKPIAKISPASLVESVLIW